MQNVVVTRKENLQTDEQGNYLFSEDQEPLLHNVDDVGICTKKHIIPIQQVDKEAGILQTGVVVRLEIHWNLQRVPALELLDPADVAWLSFDDGTDEDDSQSEDEDEDDAGERVDEEF